MADGLTDQAIAEVLGVTTLTVKRRRARIGAVLGETKRTPMLMKALRLGAFDEAASEGTAPSAPRRPDTVAIDLGDVDEAAPVTPQPSRAAGPAEQSAQGTATPGATPWARPGQSKTPPGTAALDASVSRPGPLLHRVGWTPWKATASRPEAARNAASTRKEVLTRLVQGKTYKEIAAELEITPWAVQRQATSLYAGFGIEGRNELEAAIRARHAGNTAPRNPAAPTETTDQTPQTDSARRPGGIDPVAIDLGDDTESEHPAPAQPNTHEARDDANIPERWRRERAWDQEVITAVRAGDLGAYHQLYERYYGWGIATAMEVLGDRSDAEDVVADCFADLLVRIRRGEGPQVSFGAYLRTAVRHRAYTASARAAVRSPPTIWRNSIESSWAMTEHRRSPRTPLSVWHSNPCRRNFAPCSGSPRSKAIPRRK